LAARESGNGLEFLKPRPQDQLTMSTEMQSPSNPSSGSGGIPTALLFTDAAASKVAELIREEANPALKLRVFVTGGGCSGFQYGFTFDENVEEGDTCIENQGVQLLVDPMSVQYLMGAEIDYREDLEGAQFVIRNPNATTTCGCGSSFSM
jgi:iron-sulfur cluster insertion protein